MACTHGKVKVKLFLCFEHHAIRHTGEWKYSSTHSLTLALDRGKQSASCSGYFTARERTPGTLWIWGWVASRWLHIFLWKWKCLSLLRDRLFHTYENHISN